MQRLVLFKLLHEGEYFHTSADRTYFNETIKFFTASFSLFTTLGCMSKIDV